MAYRLTQKAADDLRRIYVEGIDSFGAEAAARYHARLGEVFDILSAHPLMARERREISPPVRVHPCGSHIIIYLAEAKGDVLIIRIRHGREDWSSDPS